jgi:pimeloyl-ACP methyl ester carboxylesterase
LTAHLGTPQSIILIGHSFGSFISNALLRIDPSAADAAILTGLAYVNNGSNYAPDPRSAQSANRIDAEPGLDAGYLI